MRITIVTDTWTSQVNGVVRTLRTTCRELEALGHHPTVISPDGFRTLPCPTYPEIRLALVGATRLARHIDASAPDVLHIATEGPLGWTARRIAMRRRWPFTTAYHSRFPEYVHLRTGLPASWGYAVLRRFHGAGRATLVPTPSMAETLREHGFERPVLWSRGVDLDVFHPEGPRLARGAQPVFLCVGRLAVEKNLDAFLRLDLPGEKWVAGVGPEERRLQRSYPGVRWFGVLDAHDLACLYRSADVMVFPSRTDTFGLVQLEAMACGTPVAAFPVTGPLDVVGSDRRGGVLDVDLRVACLAALALERGPVRAHAEAYSWPAATRQFLAALQPIWVRRPAADPDAAATNTPSDRRA